MNVVLIVSDTFRRDHLGCYGNSWMKTPNIDRLADSSIVFDNAYCGSFPTVPHRADLMTGRFVFTYFDWSPLPENELVLSQILGEAGYVTMMVADTPHILRDGYRFDRGFSAWRWVRGQENDRYATAPRDVRVPCSPHKLRSPDGTMKQYLRNVSERRGEADHFVAKTMTEASRWLERNQDQERFLLYVDTFDPHEPWDPPQEYVDLYDPGYRGEEVIYPSYGACDYLSESEFKHVRALYAGEATLVDTWIGRLMEKVEDLGLLEDTAVIFTSDHGFYLGEHGLIGKSIIRGKTSQAVPLYEELARIPLIVRLPDGQNHGRRIGALVQPADILPTILELAGVPDPDTIHGKSLMPLIRREADELRDCAVSSWSIVHGPKAWRPSTVTDHEWALIYAGEVQREAAATTHVVDSIPRSEKLLGGRGGPELYNIRVDPKQNENVIEQHRDVAERLHAMCVRFLEEVHTPEEFLQYRRRIWGHT